MRVYRIAKSKYIRDLSGTGAKLYGGRWNPKGYALLYTSENKSLAALEVLVHLNRDTIPEDLQVLTLEIGDKYITEFDKRRFEDILSTEISNTRFKEEGKKWIESKSSLGLRVPSILIPGEFNILINPGHEFFKVVEILDLEDFIFDKRFFI